MTNGDVVFYLSILITVLVTLWAAILAVGLLFSEKTRQAGHLIESTPGRSIGFGAFLALVGIGLGIVLLSSKNGLFMLIGWVFLGITLGISLVGSAGLAQVMSKRMQALAPTQSALATLARGGALLIATGALPAVGWVLLFPLQLFASLGAGFQALTRRERFAYEQITAASPQTQTNQQ
jgi:hypothetical protein